MHRTGSSRANKSLVARYFRTERVNANASAMCGPDDRKSYAERACAIKAGRIALKSLDHIFEL